MMMKNRPMLISKLDMQLPAATRSEDDYFSYAGLDGNLR